jgi:hypothetical protein
MPGAVAVAVAVSVSVSVTVTVAVPVAVPVAVLEVPRYSHYNRRASAGGVAL